MLKRILIILILFMLIFSININAFGQEKQIADWATSVIRVVKKDGSNQVGTCFAVGTSQPVSYFITNNHMVVDDNGQEIKFSLSLGKDDEVDAKIIARLAIADVAVIKTKVPLYGIDPFVITDVDDIKVGDFVYALGFPVAAIADNSMDSYGKDVTITKGIIGKKTTQASDVKVYQMDAAISGGNSGGPLLNEQGQVIGINSFGKSNATNVDMNGAVLISYATDILNSRGIKFLSSNVTKTAPSPAPAATTATTPSPIPTPAPVIESNAEPAVQASTESIVNPVQVPVQAKSGMNKTLIIAISAGGAILIILIALILILKKKPVLPITPKASINGPGVFAPFDISARPCIIGRDANHSNVVNTDGKISRQHVSISYNNGVFTVTDLSSNGTFLSDGTRLEKSKPYSLKSGDSFYLHSKNNSYTLI